MDKFTPTSNELTIRFDNQEQAELFKIWLCNHGQGYHDEPNLITGKERK